MLVPGPTSLSLTFLSVVAGWRGQPTVCPSRYALASRLPEPCHVIAPSCKGGGERAFTFSVSTAEESQGGASREPAAFTV